MSRDGTKRHLSSLYRSIVGALLYMGHIEATPRVQFVSRVVICVMQTKTAFDVSKRVVRYLHHARDLATFYPYRDGHSMKEPVAFASSDLAGDRNTRKSASCVALQVDGCEMLMVKS